MSAAATLRKAASIMEERGFCSGHYEDSRGRVCALGALIMAAGGRHGIDFRAQTMPWYVEARKALESYLASKSSNFPGEIGIVHWNDEIARRKSTVIRGLLAAAAMAEKSEES